MNTRTKLLISIFVVTIVTITAFSQPDSLWSRRYDMVIGGSMMYHDGDYVFTGYRMHEQNLHSVITKIDSEGEVIWEDTWFDGLYYNQTIETPDSGIAIIGYLEHDIGIRKFNLDGNEIYSWQFELEYEPDISGFLSNDSGGFIACGHAWTSNNAEEDIISFKVSSEGELEWQIAYWDSPFDQYCSSMTELPDGDFMLVGRTHVREEDNEVFVIRIDEEGEIVWQNHYGTELIGIRANEGGYDMVITEDDSFIIVGQTLPHEEGSDFDVIMLKIDPDGEVIWLKTIDVDGDEKANSIEETIDGGFVISGFSSENLDGDGSPLIMKTDHRGNLVWSYIEEGVRISSGSFNKAIVHPDRTYSLNCGNLQQAGDTPGFLQKFGRDPHGVADGGSSFLPSWTGLVGAYPNPFNGITTFVFTVGVPAAVEINIFNGLGRRQTELVRRSYPVGQHSISWDAGGLPSGDYFARMEANGFSQTIKLVLMK